VADVFSLLKWFDVGADWRLGIDRFIKCCAAVLAINWFLDLLYILPVNDSKRIIDFLVSKNPL
jgi:hypothetical protein